jgi:hypothetical protein
MLKDLDDKAFEIKMLDNEAVIQWEASNGQAGPQNKLKKISDVNDLKVKLDQMKDGQHYDLEAFLKAQFN